MAGKKVRCQCGLVIRLGPKNTKERAPKPSGDPSSSSALAKPKQQASTSSPNRNSIQETPSARLDTPSQELVAKKQDSSNSATPKAVPAKKPSIAKPAQESKSGQPKTARTQPAQSKSSTPKQRAPVGPPGNTNPKPAAERNSNLAASKPQSPIEAKANEAKANEAKANEAKAKNARAKHSTRKNALAKGLAANQTRSEQANSNQADSNQANSNQAAANLADSKSSNSDLARRNDDEADQLLSSHTALHINSKSDFDAPTPDQTRMETKTQKGDLSRTRADLSSPTLENFPRAFSPLECKDQFGKFQILSQLGEGGMGLVFLAKDTELDRLVALKIPKSSNDSGTIDRFFREARSAANIHHPNVCTLFEFGEIDGQRFLTMEHIDGKTISQIIRDGESPKFLDAAKLILQLAEALAEAHAKGVIHRDIKPSNIMIDHRGRPVVMDFGLARRESKQETQLTQHGLLVGTPAYASPEQIRNEEGILDGRSDVYSLGVVFYVMLTGRLPFEGTSFTSILAKVLTEQPKSPSSLCDDLPFELNRICLLAMTKAVEDRYQSMLELASDLRDFCEAPDSSTASPSNKPPTKSETNRPYEASSNNSDFALPDVSEEDFDSL